MRENEYPPPPTPPRPAPACYFFLVSEITKRTVFAQAYKEIRRVLETNLIQRFTETDDFAIEEQKGTPSSRLRWHRRSGSGGSSSSIGLFNAGDGRRFDGGTLSRSNSSSDSADVFRPQRRAVKISSGGFDVAHSQAEEETRSHSSGVGIAQPQGQALHSHSGNSADVAQPQGPRLQEA